MNLKNIYQYTIFTEYTQKIKDNSKYSTNVDNKYLILDASGLKGKLKLDDVKKITIDGKEWKLGSAIIQEPGHYTSIIGNGTDYIYINKLNGTTIKDAVELFMNDPDTDGIIMIGEIGGNLEAEAGKWIQENGTKPVVAFIAGDTAPKGRTMGHAGAIVGGHSDTASAKKAILRECGVHVVDSPADLGVKIAELLG